MRSTCWPVSGEKGSDTRRTRNSGDSAAPWGLQPPGLDPPVMPGPIRSWARRTDTYHGWYVVGACFPAAAVLFGVENSNVTFGLVLSVFAVSGLVAPVLTGLVYDVTGSFTPAFVGAGVLVILDASRVAAAGRARPA